MPLTCPVGLDVGRLKDEVQRTYRRVAVAPGSEFHFHRGPEYAATRLSCDAAELAALPREVTASFAGIGNPHTIAPIPTGATVLDVCCGAGTDLLLAARRVGPGGRAIGVDMTADRLAIAASGARACGLDRVELKESDVATLDVDDATIDVVISNGVLNLVPDKVRAIHEIWRVLRPGGRTQIADITIGVEFARERGPRHRSLDRLNRRCSA